MKKTIAEKIAINGSPKFMVYTVSSTTVRNSVMPSESRICGLVITSKSGEQYKITVIKQKKYIKYFCLKVLIDCRALLGNRPNKADVGFNPHPDRYLHHYPMQTW
jgi:hypothetical protein